MTQTEALKLALEALEEPKEHIAKHRRLEAIIAIKQALAQPEQEPVAWMFQHEETGRTMCIDAQQLGWGFEKGNPRLKKIAPLYTTPPQRTWVRMTYEEADKLWESMGVDWELIRLTEAKLKDKNTRGKE